MLNVFNEGVNVTEQWRNARIVAGMGRGYGEIVAAFRVS